MRDIMEGKILEEKGAFWKEKLYAATLCVRMLSNKIIAKNKRMIMVFVDLGKQWQCKQGDDKECSCNSATVVVSAC